MERVQVKRNFPWEDLRQAKGHRLARPLEKSLTRFPLLFSAGGCFGWFFHTLEWQHVNFGWSRQSSAFSSALGFGHQME